MSILKVEATFMNYTEQEDVQQLDSQLNSAAILDRFVDGDDIYRKRDEIMNDLTDGNSVAKLPVMGSVSYIEKFSAQLLASAEELFNNQVITKPQLVAISAISKMKNTIPKCVNQNNLDIVYNREKTVLTYLREKFPATFVSSPKMSKFLVKLFGESHLIVRMFNNRPENCLTSTSTGEVVPNKNLYVSLLASNVMKMTAGNNFSSCQDYTDDEYLYLHNCLASSVKDNTLAIAYLSSADANPLYPRMMARILIAPLKYQGETFYVGYNLYYGDTDDKELLKSALISAYGERFIIAEDAYYRSYDGDEIFTFDTKPTEEIRIEMTIQGDDEYRFPYANDNSPIGYEEDYGCDYISKFVRAPKTMLDKCLAKEAEQVATTVG